MTVDDLVAEWHKAGISPSDTVLLHSSASRTMRTMREYSPTFSLSQLLETFLDAVGEKGTLLLPLFNFDFCSGIEFHYHTTPSKMGALSEVARADVRFRRTKHPIYSFAVAGADQDEFVSLSNISALSDDGPFGLLRRKGGKIAILDLDDQNSMTAYHHVEEVLAVNYRYHKFFTGTYVDENNEASKRTYALYVRDEMKGVTTDVNRAGELLWQQGKYSGERPGVNAGLRVVDAEQFFVVVADIIMKGRAIDYLYSINEQQIK